MSDQPEAGSRYREKRERQARIWNRASLGLAALLLLGVYRAATSVPYPTRRLPDGSNTGLLGVTYGEPRSVPIGNAWDQLFAGISQGSNVVELPKRESLATWLYHSRYYDWRSPDCPTIVLRGSAGDEWDGDNESSLPGLGLRKGEVVGRGFDVFPRREHFLSLRVYQRPTTWLGRGAEKWVEFSVGNPAFREYPTWTPAPYPINRRSGNLEVSLTSLRTGLEFPDGKTLATVPYYAATIATFRVRQHGKPGRDWEPVAVTYQDATGNRMQGHEDRLTWNADEVGFPMNGQLPSDETWKVRAEFSRCRSSHGLADQTWSVKGFPLPDYTGPATWKTVQLAPGVQLETRIERCEPAHGVVMHLQLMTDKRSNARVAVLCQTSKGGVTPGELDWRSLNEDPPEWVVQFPPGATSANIGFLVYESQVFEFLAQPVRVR